MIARKIAAVTVALLLMGAASADAGLRRGVPSQLPAGWVTAWGCDLLFWSDGTYTYECGRARYCTDRTLRHCTRTAPWATGRR